MSDEKLQAAREAMQSRGIDLGNATNDQLRQALVMQGEAFRDDAPTTAADAATISLDGVRADQWRILVGDDAIVLDRLVREDPESAYTEEFYERLRASTNWKLGELIL
jgi:hypothetical protein